MTGCEWTRQSEACGAEVVAEVTVAYLEADSLRLCEPHLEEANTDQDGVTVRRLSKSGAFEEGQE